MTVRSLDGLQSSADKRHQVDTLDRRVGRRLRALQHDRAERACRHDGRGASRLQLLDALLADALALLTFLEEESAPCAAAEGIRAVACRLGNRRAEPLQQHSRLLGMPAVPAQVTGIVEGHVVGDRDGHIPGDRRDEHR